MNDDTKLTISVEIAAKRLGIGRQLAYELARTGKLPGVVRLGRKRLVVSLAGLERALNATAADPPVSTGVSNGR